MTLEEAQRILDHKPEGWTWLDHGHPSQRTLREYVEDLKKLPLGEVETDEDRAELIQEYTTYIEAMNVVARDVIDRPARFIPG